MGVQKGAVTVTQWLVFLYIYLWNAVSLCIVYGL